jgi:tetratricopeptide (TPR) repeat protein
VQAEQESSFDITDSTVLIRQTDESKTVDRSVSVGGDVSGTVNVGETVNVNNVVNVEPITVSRDEWETLAGKMNALVESAGTQTTQSAEPLTGKQSELASEGLRKQASKLSLTPEIQRHTDAWVRRKDGRNKVEETGQQVGPDTGDPETYRRLGDEASNSDDYEHAIENYSRAINLDDRNSTAYNNRAAAYIKMREYESAVQDFGKAIRLEPNDADLYSNRGAVHHTIGQYENAITNYGEAIRLKPSEANFYAFRALSYAALGYRWREGDKGGEQYELAIQDYVEAIRIVPNIATNPNILFDYVCMAKAYQQLKQFSQAKKIMDIAISRDPQEHYYYVTRASIYSAIGQPENALRDVEEAFRIDPELAKNEHAIAWYNTFKQSAASAVSGPQWSERPPNDMLKIANCTASDVIVWIKYADISWADQYLVLTKDELLWIERGRLGSKSKRHAASHGSTVSMLREGDIGWAGDHVLIDSGGSLPTGKFEFRRHEDAKAINIIRKVLGLPEDEQNRIDST